MGYCDVPKGNTDMNFVDFGNADLPFLFILVRTLSSASSTMIATVFSKIQVT